MVLGSCEQTSLPSVGMTVLVEKPYLQQNADTLQDVIKALVEGMVFITSPKNKPAVLETITKQFKMTDPAPPKAPTKMSSPWSGWKNTANPTFPWTGLRILQRLLKSKIPKSAISKSKISLTQASSKKSMTAVSSKDSMPNTESNSDRRA